ncbi:MAG: DUF4239 domain-containing protein [Thermocrispum sp.]
MSMLATGLIVVLGAAAASAGGFLLISKFVPDRWLVADGDAASALYAAIGMAYAILIAIAAIAVWEPHSAADAASSEEPAQLLEAHRAAQALPSQDRTEIQALITRYTAEVVRDEWPVLRADKEANPSTADTFERLRDRVDALDPDTARQQAATDDLSDAARGAADARRARVAAATANVPQPLWPVLALGGMVSIGFLYLFGLERTFPNGLMMATVGGMIAVVLFVIYEMEYPYSRGMAIQPDAFRAALTELREFSPVQRAGPP